MEKKFSNDGNILTVVATDLGNADTSYAYFNLTAEGYNEFCMFFTITATTITLEATCDAATVVDASATWLDVTSALTGSATATATGGWIVDTPVAFRRVRVKRLTTNATNAIAIDLVRMQAG